MRSHDFDPSGKPIDGASTYRSSLAERIAWTSGHLPSSAMKVLLALSSCGDWQTGERCYPLLSTLVARSGLSLATVKRCLGRLTDPEQPGGPWVVAKRRRHRHSTTYEICVDRLARTPPKEQQTTIPTVRSEAQNEPQAQSEAQNELQDPRSEAQNEPPISLSDLSVRTHTPRAREDAEPIELELPLVGATPPPRCTHPHAHAWCDGRVHVPKGLHFEFLDRLGTRPGESRAAKAGRLIAFYAEEDAKLAPEDDIGDNDFKFWRTRFAAAFAAPPETRHASRPPEDLDQAAQATRAAAVAHRRAAEDAAEAAAILAYEALTADARAALEHDARQELQPYRARNTLEAFEQMVRQTVIRYLAETSQAERKSG